MINICNTSEAPRKGKARNEVFYLDKICARGYELDKIDVFCTDGDIRPPYPYQWVAKAKIIPGDDDACEGVGERPLKALQALYASVVTLEQWRSDQSENDSI